MPDPLSDAQYALLRRAAEPGGVLPTPTKMRAAKRLLRLSFVEWQGETLVATPAGLKYLMDHAS